MADDIFLSPEEQDERARQWFKSNAPALVIGIALGLAAITGYNKYKDNAQQQAEVASNLYQQTISEIQDSELADINEQITTLKSEHAKTPYAAKAVLVKAKQTAVNDMDAAFTELQWVLDNSSDSGLQHTARLRQAKIKIEQNDLSSAKKLASHSPTDAFESHYQEVLGDIALAEGDKSAARAHYQAAADALDGLQDNYIQVLNIKLDRLPEASTEVPADAVTVQPSAEVSAEPEVKVEEAEEPAVSQ